MNHTHKIEVLEPCGRSFQNFWRSFPSVLYGTPPPQNGKCNSSQSSVKDAPCSMNCACSWWVTTTGKQKEVFVPIAFSDFMFLQVSSLESSDAESILDTRLENAKRYMCARILIYYITTCLTFISKTFFNSFILNVLSVIVYGQVVFS